MAMYSVKSISVLMVAFSLSFVAINCGYDDGSYCYDTPTQNHYLDSATIKKIDIRNQQQFRLVYENNNKIFDTIKVLNAGSMKFSLRLRDYTVCDYKDYIEGVSFYFIGNEDKRNTMMLNIMPVYIRYYDALNYSYSSHSNYSLSPSTESIEVKWNKYTFSSTVSKLEQTGGGDFYPTVMLGLRTFNNVYKVVLNDSCHIYLNKSTIAQIRIGKETWTNVE